MIRRLAARRETSVVLAIVIVIVIATAVNHSFLFSGDGFRNLLLAPSIYVLLAAAQAIVIIPRQIDLSIASILGLTAYAVGRMFTDMPFLPVPVVILAGILFGTVLGAINGALVAVARVPALVITLGTQYIFRGIDIAWAGSNRINASDLPDSFLSLGTGGVGGISWLAVIAVVVVVIVALVLGYTRPGRELYAVGSNPDAAVLYGLKAGRRIFASFLASGTLAGASGVLFAALYGNVQSNAGSGYELQAVAAAVIGGVAIFGGSGTVAGAALGAVLLTTIDRALPSVGVPDVWQGAVVGALIIGAIVLDRGLAIRTRARLARARAAGQAVGHTTPSSSPEVQA